MAFHVNWKPTARDRLTELWIEASDRADLARSAVVTFSPRVLKHPVSRIYNNARSLISAANLANVAGSDETPGVFNEKLTTSPCPSSTCIEPGRFVDGVMKQEFIDTPPLKARRAPRNFWRSLSWLK